MIGKMWRVFCREEKKIREYRESQTTLFACEKLSKDNMYKISKSKIIKQSHEVDERTHSHMPQSKSFNTNHNFVLEP